MINVTFWKIVLLNAIAFRVCNNSRVEIITKGAITLFTPHLEMIVPADIAILGGMRLGVRSHNNTFHEAKNRSRRFAPRFMIVPIIRREKKDEFVPCVESNNFLHRQSSDAF